MSLERAAECRRALAHTEDAHAGWPAVAVAARARVVLYREAQPLLRLAETEGVCISLDIDVAYDFRDALYDDASSQSSSDACDLIQHLLDDGNDERERTISAEVAADLVRGIDRVSNLYDLPSALVELRAYLRRSS